MCRHRPADGATQTLSIRGIPLDLHHQVLAARDQLERELGVHLCVGTAYRRLILMGMNAIKRDQKRNAKRRARKAMTQ